MRFNDISIVGLGGIGSILSNTISRFISNDARENDPRQIINLIDVKPNIKIFEVNYADVSLLSNTICQSVFYAASSASSAAGSSATAATNGSSTNGFTVACGGSSLTGSPTATGGSGASQTVVGSSGSGVFNGISSTLSSLPASGYMVTYNQDLGKISVTGTIKKSLRFILKPLLLS